MVIVVPEVTYSDLFLLSFVPIIIQAVAGFYVLRLYPILGRHISVLFAGINGAMLWFDVTLLAQFFDPHKSPGNAVIEPWGIVAGFVVPTAVAALLFILQKELRDSLIPPRGDE